MSKSQVDSVALLVAVLAGALALMVLAAGFAELASISGLILLLVLLAYDREGYRSLFQSFAFSAVCAFSLTIACAVIYQQLAAHGEVHLANRKWLSEWMPITCAFATGIFWAIDRARMSGREQAGFAETSTRAQRPPSFVPGTVAAPPVRFATPTQATPPPAPPPMPAPAPSATLYGGPPASAANEPNPPMTSAPEPVPDQSMAAQPLRQNPTLPESSAVPPNAIPAPRGKQTMIYVTLVGEGLNVLRSVLAEHLGRDYYRIVDTMPEGEIWQFQPGQVVRCKKQTLSSGKALVAIEEAPRAT